MPRAQRSTDLSSEVAKELREVESKMGEFTERKVAAEDQLERIDIRAPQDSYVLQFAVHTVDGVINAGDVIMQIVLGEPPSSPCRRQGDASGSFARFMPLTSIRSKARTMKSAQDHGSWLGWPW
jgi:HlyD family secretion protein